MQRLKFSANPDNQSISAVKSYQGLQDFKSIPKFLLFKNNTMQEQIQCLFNAKSSLVQRQFSLKTKASVHNKFEASKNYLQNSFEQFALKLINSCISYKRHPSLTPTNKENKTLNYCSVLQKFSHVDQHVYSIFLLLFKRCHV